MIKAVAIGTKIINKWNPKLTPFRRVKDIEILKFSHKSKNISFKFIKANTGLQFLIRKWNTFDKSLPMQVHTIKIVTVA